MDNNIEDYEIHIHTIRSIEDLRRYVTAEPTQQIVDMFFPPSYKADIVGKEIVYLIYKN